MISKTKLLGFSALVVLVFFAMTGFASAATLAQWELVSGGTASNVNTNVNAGSFVGGSGISAIEYGANGAFASQWASTSSQDASDYYQITVSPKAGYDMTVTDVNFGIRRSGEGPQNYLVQWSKSSSFGSHTTIGSGFLADDLESTKTLSGLNILVDEGETLYVRIFGYGSTAAGGTLRINDNTLNVGGSVTQIASNPKLVLRKTQDITSTRNGTIELENNGNVAWNNVQLSDTGELDVLFYYNNAPVSSVNLPVGQKKTITVVPVERSDVGFGGKSTTITATADDGTTKATISLSLDGSFCEFGQVGGDLEITNIDISNEGSGEDDEWNLLDTVEVEIDVENTGNEDLNDIFIEIGLFDSTGKNQISDLDFENEDEEEYDLGDLDEGDEETVTFRFQVPADFEDGNYRFTVKVYSDDAGEDLQCTDTASDLDVNDKYTTIDVSREDDEGKFVAFDSLELTPAEGTCGDRISMTLDVYNIGDEDQDQVKVTLKNAELGIDEFIEIRTDLDQGDKETLSFDFNIPENAKDKVYNLLLSAEYDYNRGSYKQELDDDTSVSLRVVGCGTSGGTGGTPQGGDNVAIITATLESDEVVAGGEVVVKATVTNLKSQRTAFAVDALGYQSWATLDEISPRIVDLAAGESKEVLLTFTVDDAIEGEQSFDVEVKDGLGGVETREIALNVESVSSTGTGGLGFDMGDSSFLWIIGAVNVILVVLIIVVAVRVARR